MNIFILVFIITVLLIVIYSRYLSSREHYQEPYLIIKTIQTPRPIMYLKEKYQIYDLFFKSLPDKYPYIKIDNTDDSPATICLTNAFDLYNSANSVNQQVVTLTNNPNLSVFFVNINKTSLILDLNKNNISDLDISKINNRKPIVIGYLNDYEVYIIQNILIACDLDLKTSQIKLIKINAYEIIDNLFLTNIIDIFFYFNTLQNPLFYTITANDYNIITYNKIDTVKIKHLIPFSRIQNIVLKEASAIVKLDNQVNANVLLIDNLIYKNTTDSANIYLDIIIDLYDNRIINNYYMQYFKFVKQQYIKTEDDNIENFNTDSDLILNITLNGKNKILIQDLPNIQNNKKTLFYKIFAVKDDNNTPFMVNDALKIDTVANMNSEYKGIYYVYEVHAEYSIISKYAAIYQTSPADIIELSKTGLSQIEYIVPAIDLKLKNNNLVYVTSLDKEAVYFNKMLKIINLQENIALNKNYICFEDPSITNQHICEGNINVDGTTKAKFTWDKPCTKNIECDFYLANKNNINDDGGCKNSGFCQFPLGIKNISYTKYKLDDQSYPLCKGCSINIHPKDCCSYQKLSKSLNSPDYIFD